MQKINQRPLRWALTAAAFAIIGAGCAQNNQNTASTGEAPATGADSGASEVKEVTIGYLPNIVLAQPLLGLQNDEYEKLMPGVTFKSVDAPAGPALLEQLRSGRIHIAFSGPYPPLNAFARSRDVIVLAGAAKGGTQLMVRKDAPFKSVKDLKGKKIGINQSGSTVDAMVRYNLLEAGLDPEKDVTLLPVEPAQQADALKRGEVDAVSAPAPWPSVVAAQGNGRPLLDSKQILDNGDYWQGVAFTTKKFADANPDFIKKFVEANRQITERLNSNRAKGDAEVLAAWTKASQKAMDPQVAKNAFATIEFATEAKPADFQRAAEVAQKVGFLREAAKLDGLIYQP